MDSAVAHGKDCGVEYSARHKPGKRASHVNKTQLKPHLKKQWCIPAKQSGEFVARMEDILEVYALPYDKDIPMHFVGLVVDYIVQNGTMKDLRVLQQSPFNNFGSVVELFRDTSVFISFYYYHPFLRKSNGKFEQLYEKFDDELSAEKSKIEIEYQLKNSRYTSQPT